MIVVDTNILVYSTFEDSENHSKALEIIEKYNKLLRGG